MRFAAGNFSDHSACWLAQLVAESCKSMCMQIYQPSTLSTTTLPSEQQQQQQQRPQHQIKSKSELQQITSDHLKERRNFNSDREFWNLFSCNSQKWPMTIMSQIDEEPTNDSGNNITGPSSRRFDQQQQGRRYDLVIFAASGTVGRFLVEEMALVVDKHYSSNSQQQQQTSVATSTMNLKELRDPLQFAQQSNGGGTNTSTRRVSVPQYMDSINWAIAGRSAVRLSDTLCKAEISTGVSNLSSQVPVILADLDHHRSLLEMCSKTGLVINCAGPYSSDGEALIRACLETRTNYIDLSHETSFCERVRVNYNAMARRNNVYIMNGCGFQSMSAEMGLNFIKQVVDGQIGEVKIMLNLNDTKALVKQDGGRRRACDRRSCGIISLGMWNSLLLEKSQSKNAQPTNATKTLTGDNKYSQTETPNDSKDRQKYLLRKDTQTLVRDLVEFKNKKASGWLQLIRGFNEGSRRYCLPVNSFTSDESQLTRGEMNNYESRQPDLDDGWTPVICTSYLSLRNFYEVLALFLWVLVFNVVVRIPLFRSLMRFAPSVVTLGRVTSSSSSKYIDRDSLNHIKFCQTFIAYGTPGDDSGDPLEKREKNLKRKQEQLLVARVVGPEPNHVATATFAIQAALAMLLERDHLPSGGGVLTPGAAFSETNIIYQLKRRNIKFEVLKKA